MGCITTRDFSIYALSFCLAAALGTLAADCDARPQQQKAIDPPATINVSAKKNPKPKADSSSLTANDYDSAEPNAYRNSLGLHLLRDFAYDQKAIWTSPANLRLVDADWLLPLAIATGGMLATDTETSKHLSNSPSRLKNSENFSNYGLASMAAATGGLYLLGHFTHDDHKRETGLLAGEAALNSLAVDSTFKYAFGRERPLQDNYQGNFWQGGNSFPSEHAAAAWSMASVIAHEYPSPYVSLLSYGLAAAISASRVDAKQHFPSDVLIGSAIGWLSGEIIYRRHHDPEVGGGDWETYAESRDASPARRLTRSGSPYVELDSWIYPAIERLAAMGYIRSQFLGMRPWTRIESAHLVEEAGDEIRADGESDSSEASRIYYPLQTEFEPDLAALSDASETAVRLESLYTGATGISGAPLNDSYHFGQTIINNYGRPYQQGFNAYNGFSGYATAGRFTLYVRGEFQHSPFAPAYSLPVRQAIATADLNPLQPAIPFATLNHFTLLDTYAAANVSGWTLAFGKQSLWWSPAEGGALIFSDNAAPIYMFRASRIEPITLPWILRWLGPMKSDLFVGKLSGNQFPPRPLLHGEKITFKPTPNLELGFSRTAEFGGVGRAITPAAIWNSYTGFFHSSQLYASNNNPGKRTGGFDFSYRIPFVRNWLTIYTDSLSDDDPSPLRDAPRDAFRPGIYLSHVPKIAKLDFRVEAVYTALPSNNSNSGQFVYFDTFYHDLYTNKQNIIGDWIGREGTGFQAWSTYWFGPRTSMQLGYRHAKVAKDFIPSGETLNDGSVKIDWWLHSGVSLSASLQYEKWLAPILAPGPQTNWTSSAQITFEPRNFALPFHSSHADHAPTPQNASAAQ